MQQLLERGIAMRRGIMNAHREQPYRGIRHHDLSRSEQAQDRRILIPLYAQLSDEDQQYVADCSVAVCASNH